MKPVDFWRATRPRLRRARAAFHPAEAVHRPGYRLGLEAGRRRGAGGERDGGEGDGVTDAWRSAVTCATLPPGIG